MSDADMIAEQEALLNEYNREREKTLSVWSKQIGQSDRAEQMANLWATMQEKAKSNPYYTRVQNQGHNPYYNPYSPYHW